MIRFVEEQTNESRPWHKLVGARVLLVPWAYYSRHPYATDLLVALSEGFPNVTFFVAFDGFDGRRDGATLSLWALPREAGRVADLEQAVRDVSSFCSAFVAGWVSRDTSRPSAR